VLVLCSNGLGHQSDEVEFDEAAVHCTPPPPAAEPAEPQEETFEEQVTLGDAGCEQIGLVDDVVKPVEDDFSVVTAAEPEPAATEQSHQEITSNQERPTETEELEQEVEGKLSWFSAW